MCRSSSVGGSISPTTGILNRIEHGDIVRRGALPDAAVRPSLAVLDADVGPTVGEVVLHQIVRMARVVAIKSLDRLWRDAEPEARGDALRRWGRRAIDPEEGVAHAVAVYTAGAFLNVEAGHLRLPVLRDLVGRQVIIGAQIDDRPLHTPCPPAMTVISLADVTAASDPTERAADVRSISHPRPQSGDLGHPKTPTGPSRLRRRGWVEQLTDKDGLQGGQEANAQLAQRREIAVATYVAKNWRKEGRDQGPRLPPEKRW
jgi:hypothetical protein